jgi:hypothetical protein
MKSMISVALPAHGLTVIPGERGEDPESVKGR